MSQETIQEKRSCPECQSLNTKKAGFRPTRKGRKQLFQCNDCGRSFY